MRELNICVALTVAGKGDEDTCEHIASRIDRSIKNGGIAIYNGNNETVPMPLECSTETIHPNYVEDEFGGWEYYKEVRMIDFAKCGESQQHALLARYFTPEIVEAWLELRHDFCGKDTVAIRVESDFPADDERHGEFYEYIVNKAA